MKVVIRKLDLSLDINTKTDEAVLSKILGAQEKTKQTKLAAIRPDIWRIIMNKPITKLTTAAAVLLMVSLVTTIFLTSTIPSKTSGISRPKSFLTYSDQPRSKIN